MTDIVDTADLTVEQRLALLEARLSPAPQAVVPPITIGSLTNVPAPGSQIAAQWAQDASRMLVHQFATIGAIATWAAPNGSFAVALDTGVVYRRFAGAWGQYTPWTGSAAGVAVNFSTTVTQQASVLNIPIDGCTRVADISCFLRLDLFNTSSAQVELRFDGVSAATYTVPQTNISLPLGANWPWSVSLQASNITVPAGRTVPVAVVVTVAAVGGGVGSTQALAHLNRVDATVFPKGY